MIGIPVGLLTANAVEWVVHKHVLHGLGRNKASFWAFHWHDHHRTVRKNDHYDPIYERPFWKQAPTLKEAVGIAGMAATAVPLLPVAPFFTLTLWYSGWNYYRKHKKAHLDLDWAKTHLPWHYDHHMGPDQNANWCVTRPWFDHVMGTRKPYLGTEKAERDAAKRAQAAQRGSGSVPSAKMSR